MAWEECFKSDVTKCWHDDRTVDLYKKTYCTLTVNFVEIENNFNAYNHTYECARYIYHVNYCYPGTFVPVNFIFSKTKTTSSSFSNFSFSILVAH